MYCKKCGNQMEENSKFCNKCGFSIDSSLNSENMETQPVKKTNKVSFGKCILKCLLFSIVLFLGLGIIKMILSACGINMSDNLNYVISLIQINIPVWIIILGPIILYIVKNR